MDGLRRIHAKREPTEKEKEGVSLLWNHFVDNPLPTEEEKEGVSLLWNHFVDNPLPKSDFEYIGKNELQTKVKGELKGAIVILRKIVPSFLDSLLDYESESSPSKPPSLERILNGFHLFWSFLKHFFPSENLIESLDTSKVVVDLFRLDKTLSPNRSYDFSYQHFLEPNFSNLYLKSDSFFHCRLLGANFSYTILENISFEKAKFAPYEDEYREQKIEEAFSAKFSNCIFKNINFTDSIGQSLNFSDSKGEVIFFRNAQLERGIFRKCVWREVDLTNVQLQNSDFSWAILEMVTMTNDSDVRGAIFSDAMVNFKRVKNGESDDEQNQIRANILSNAQTLFKASIFHKIKDLILLEKGGIVDQKNINKALFYDPEESNLDPEELKRREDKGYETINSIEISIDEDLYFNTSNLKSLIIEQLSILSSRITFYQLEDLSAFITDFENKLLEAKEQWEDQFFFKTISESKIYLDEGKLKEVFGLIDKLKLPDEFQVQYILLKTEFRSIEKEPSENDNKNLIEQTRILIKMLLDYVLESTS